MPADRAKIPRPTVKRLSFYLRELEALAGSERQTISSKELGSALGLTDAQVRKAREDGHFDDLPGKGKPLNLRAGYDPNWWVKQFVDREGVSLLPPSLEIRRTVERETL